MTRALSDDTQAGCSRLAPICEDQQKKKKDSKKDDMRGGVELQCGRLCASCQCAAAFIFSFSDSLTVKSKALEKLVTQRSVVRELLCMLCYSVSEGKRECRAMEDKRRESKIVFHLKA